MIKRREKKRGFLPLQIGQVGGEIDRRIGNAARKVFCCNLICHVTDTKVCASVYISRFPNRTSRDNREDQPYWTPAEVKALREEL